MKRKKVFIGGLAGIVFVTISACGASTPVVNAPAAATIGPRPSAASIPSAVTHEASSGSSTRKSNPTATQGPAIATATIVEYPHNEKAMVLVPTIVISAAKDDPKIPLVQEAVDHWNQFFQQIGTPFHLGAIVQTIDLIPETDYQPLSNAGMAQIDKLPGDMLIVFASDPKFISYNHAFGPRRLIAIQGNPGGRNSLPIDLDVIAHEMGHAIGLGHNNGVGMLMCGGPSTPADCGSFTDAWLAYGQFAPLTDAEIAYLKQIYPTNWQPTP